MSKEDSLSFFLIDDGEFGYGMYLSSIYEKYILIQNKFLNDVINNINNSDNKKLEYIKEKINEEINIQKAKEYNIFSFKFKNFNSFDELIFFYSYQNSCNNSFEFENSKNDNNNINFIFEEIEEQLKYLLLKKKKFNNNINFVIYEFEGLRGENYSSILNAFLNKYPQKQLNQLEQKYLNGYKNNNNLIRILFSLQSMIKLYSEIPSFDQDIIIEETFNVLKFFFEIDYDLKDLFQEPFMISQIISIYEYLEYLCFDVLKNKIQPEYKLIIDKEKIEQIEKFFKDNQSVVIDKLIISQTIRIFISRYLVGKNFDIDINNIEIFNWLSFRVDCWKKEIYSNEQFFHEIEKLKTLNIKVGEALNLYEILCGNNLTKPKEEIKREKRKKRLGKKSLF